MKQITAVRAIALLVVIVLVAQYVEKRDDYTCQVEQLASLHRWFIDEGMVTREQIPDSVRHVRLVEFDGQAWREELDRGANAILMGGDIASRVLASLDGSREGYRGSGCGGFVSWTIWDRRPIEDEEDFRQFEIETIHDVTPALESIPADERRQYMVGASLIFSKHNWDGQVSWHSSRVRRVGEISAKKWLDGMYTPAPFSDWYAAWLANNDSAPSSARD
ncbi:MAG: hypothetical protein J4G18_17110 [Anaerolineae bacterium]|nr:hypothetical protein [Anaerolineae bacterium]